jgi:hypothetical protein
MNISDDCDIADPRVDGDFHLSDPDSACIDAGTDSYSLGMDFEGDSRPARGGYDIGPDEVSP